MGELGQPVAQDGFPDVADQSGLLGEGEELLGPEQPTLGVQPAGQRFEADDVAGRQLDDRLVVRNKLAAVDSSPQLGRRAQGERCRLLQTFGIRLDTVTAPELGPVHRPVGVTQQVGGSSAIGGVDRKADAGGDEELDALDVDRFANRHPQPLGNVPRIERAIGPSLQNDDELVASEASQQRSVADGAADPLGQHRQQTIADAVPKAVVDRLEVVEVDEQQGDRPDRRGGQDLVDSGQQLGAVGQPGEIVVGGCPAQLLGDSSLFGDVFDVGDRQRHTVVLGDGDARARPHVRAVAAFVALVEQVRVGDPQLEAGAVDGRGLEVVGVGDLADAAPDEVVSGTMQHLGQRAIGVDDGRVVEAHEGHSRRGGVERLLESPARLLEGLPAAFPLGHVEKADDRPVRGPTGLFVGRLDDRDRPVGAGQSQRRAVDARSPAGLGQPSIELRAISDLDELARRASRRVRLVGRPVSSAAVRLAPRTLPDDSIEMTASGRSSSRMRSSDSVSIKRSMVWWR